MGRLSLLRWVLESCRKVLEFSTSKKIFVLGLGFHLKLIPMSIVVLEIAEQKLYFLTH